LASLIGPDSVAEVQRPATATPGVLILLNSAHTTHWRSALGLPKFNSSGPFRTHSDGEH